MSDVKSVTVATRNPSGNDLGSVEIGFYTLSDGLVTMTDCEGLPLRNANGDLMTHRLGAGENHVTIAKRMRLKMWRDENDDGNGFNRRIDYGPAFGVV